MTLAGATKDFWRNYFTFKGRSSRRTYWLSILFLVIVTFILDRVFPGTTYLTVDSLGHQHASYMFSVVLDAWMGITLIPALAAGSRRLHDTGKSAGRLFWLLIPGLGALLLLIWLTRAGDPSVNRHGEAPAK